MSIKNKLMNDENNLDSDCLLYKFDDCIQVIK